MVFSIQSCATIATMSFRAFLSSQKELAYPLIVTPHFPPPSPPSPRQLLTLPM